MENHISNSLLNIKDELDKLRNTAIEILKMHDSFSIFIEWNINKIEIVYGGSL